MRAVVWVIALGACDVASPALGYDAPIQIPKAQYRPGAFPEPTGGPAATSVSTSHSTVEIGTVDERLHAVLDASATGTIIGVEGAAGTWILPAGPPDSDAPSSATITTDFAMSPSFAPGPFQLLVSAVDRDGRIGAPTSTMLIAAPVEPPDGDLVIGLQWQSTADLDIHVIDPLGNEAWVGSPNTWKPPPPGEAVDPNAYLAGGILDHDGNASCHRDGAAPNEHVIWKTRTGSRGDVAPVILSGKYTIRVDTPSLCEDASTAWYVDATYAGQVLGAARGVSIIDDEQAAHGAGAGVLALTFTIP